MRPLVGFTDCLKEQTFEFRVRGSAGDLEMQGIVAAAGKRKVIRHDEIETPGDRVMELADVVACIAENARCIIDKGAARIDELDGIAPEIEQNIAQTEVAVHDPAIANVRRSYDANHLVDNGSRRWDRPAVQAPFAA